MPSKTKIKVAEIYKSIHGEMPHQGKLASIVRLAGCSSRCRYCDAKRFWKTTGRGVSTLSVAGVISRVKRHKAKEVLVTGGEPLHQKGTAVLIRRLIREGFRVTLETNGAFALNGMPRGLTVVMDLKTPGSFSRRETLASNLRLLKKSDVLKVVVTSKRDYDWAKRIINKNRKSLRCEVVFSPVYGKLSPKSLYSFMLADNSRCRMQIQLHRLLGLK